MKKGAPYFAWATPAAPQLAEQIAAQMAQSVHQTASWFALVDTAFDHGRVPMKWPAPGVPVYSNDRLAALHDISPVLYQLEAGQPAALSAQVRRLIWHASDRPMLAFVQSDLSATDLACELASVATVNTSDGQPFLLRWADTRVAAHLPASLQPAHWARLTRSLRQWWFVDRHGGLTQLPIDGRSPAPPDGRIELSDDELDRLIDAGLPDALAQALHDHCPERLQAVHGACLYRNLQRLCALARAQRADAMAQLLPLGVALLSSDMALLDDPRLEPWLAAHAGDGTGFEDALDELLRGAPG